jgi:acetate kinase
MRTILAVNAGSSSLKLSLFDADDESLRRLAHESFEDLEDDQALRKAVLGGIGEWCRRHTGGRQLVAAGHRVVHGGTQYSSPVLVDDEVLGDLEALASLAPLHQPLSLAPIRSLRRSQPELLQVACFDTAFHHGHAPAVDRYGLPNRLWRDGIRRYGFHGLSYEYVVSALGRIAPEIASGRVVVAHLGSGASLCAVHEGRSVDTTMGFSALSGLVMGTRCGDLDPGAVLHLLRDGSRKVADVEHLLYRESGLRGISGLSGDVRELLDSGSDAAREAIDCFVLGVVRAIGAMTAVLGGLDALVFTAGIGEHSREIRARVCQASAWTGLSLDEEANARGGPCISVPESKVAAWVIPTDEERMIALHTRELLGAAST